MNKSLRHHIAAFIDWYAWGFCDQYNADWEVNPRHVLNAFRAHEKGVFPQKLTYKVIEDYHLTDKYDRQGTLYYRSRNLAHYAVLMVDLDDKDRTARDTELAWHYLRDHYFPGEYGEPSTSGSGTHGYLLINRQGVASDAFLNIVHQLEEAIRFVVNQRGFRCTFDQLCGMPNTSDNGIISNFSQLAKFPRLNTPKKMKEYLRSSAFSVDEVELIIKDMLRCKPAEDVAYLERCWDNEPIPGDDGECNDYRICEDNDNINVLDGEDAELDPSGNTLLCDYITGNKVLDEGWKPLERQEKSKNLSITEYITGNREPQEGWEEAVEGQLDHKNHYISEYITGNKVPSGRYDTYPSRRMSRCAWDLATQFKRVPATDEILDQYESLGLNTGHDHDGNRRRLAEANHVWLLENFDVSRLEGFVADNYLPLIQTHVTELIRHNIRQHHRSQYTDHQLAVMLYVVEKAAFGNNGRLAPFVCSNDQIEGMFRKLNMDVPNRRQLAVMKQALVEAGLVIIVDANFHEGRAKKFGLGPAHPLYLRQTQLPEGIVPVTPVAPQNSAWAAPSSR